MSTTRKLFTSQSPSQAWVYRKFGARRINHKHCITDEEEQQWIEKRKEKDLKWKKDFDRATKEMLDNEANKRRDS